MINKDKIASLVFWMHNDLIFVWKLGPKLWFLKMQDERCKVFFWAFSSHANSILPEKQVNITYLKKLWSFEDDNLGLSFQLKA
jgi:hypothetical protein